MQNYPNSQQPQANAPYQHPNQSNPQDQPYNQSNPAYPQQFAPYPPYGGYPPQGHPYPPPNQSSYPPYPPYPPQGQQYPPLNQSSNPPYPPYPPQGQQYPPPNQSSNPSYPPYPPQGQQYPPPNQSSNPPYPPYPPQGQQYPPPNQSSYPPYPQGQTFPPPNQSSNLPQGQPSNESDQKVPQGKDILCSPKNELNGIINFLRKNSKDIRQEISIKASSNNNDKLTGPYNVINYENTNVLYSSDSEKSAWISFNFGSHKILLKSYTIRSNKYGENSHHPKSWILEGSNDNQAFIHIDEQVNCDYLNSSNAVHNFQINNAQNKPFKIFRFTLTNKNWAKRNYLSFNAIEFFGTLI